MHLGSYSLSPLLTFSLLFFRAGSLADSFTLLSNAVDFSHFRESIIYILKDYEVLFGILMVVFLMLAEYLHAKYDLVRYVSSKPLLSAGQSMQASYFSSCFSVFFIKQKFIYFQF